MFHFSIRHFLLIVFSSFFVVFSLSVKAQNSTLEFVETEYDFGKIPFQDTLTHRFYFKNASEQDIRITDISTDCACTFFKEKEKDSVSESTGLNRFIQKGDSTFVEFVYLPYNYGSFVKTFTLKTDKAGTQVLMFKGNLQPILNKERDFKYQVENLSYIRKRTNYLNFGNISTKSPITKKFEFYNASDKDFIFTGKMDTPEHIQVRFDSTHILKAGEIGAIYVIYAPLLKNDFGYVKDEITLFGTQDKQDAQLGFKATANVEEYFPENLTIEALEAYPMLVLDKSYVNLGTHYIKTLKDKRDSLVATFVLKNKSNMPLRIHKIVEGYGCQLLTEKDQWNEVSPHSNTIIQILFQLPEDKGTYTRSVTLICNDPREPIKTLKLKATLR